MTLSYDEHIKVIDQKVDDIILRAESYMWTQDDGEVRVKLIQAYEFAREAHKSVTRLSWEPYISHPVAATEILLSLNPDIPTMQACFMHDVIEDTDFTYEDIEEEGLGDGQPDINLDDVVEVLQDFHGRREEKLNNQDLVGNPSMKKKSNFLSDEEKQKRQKREEKVFWERLTKVLSDKGVSVW